MQAEERGGRAVEREDEDGIDVNKAGVEDNNVIPIVAPAPATDDDDDNDEDEVDIDDVDDGSNNNDGVENDGGRWMIDDRWWLMDD